MSNMENNLSSEKNTQKTEALFESLQNVPEELLERSEKGSSVDRVIVFIKQHKQICAACVALAFAGLCFIGYRSINGGSDNAASSINSAQEMLAGDAMDGAGMESFPDSVTDTAGGTIEEEVKAEEDLEPENIPDVSLNKDEVENAVEEIVGNMNVTKDLYAAYMPKDVPEDYEFESVSMSKGEKEEVLQVRLLQEDGKYMQLIIKRKLEAKGQETASDTPPDSANGAAGTNRDNVLAATDLTMESVEKMCALVAGSEEVNSFIVEYEDGVSVECEGTSPAEDIYKVLAAYGQNVAE